MVALVESERVGGEDGVSEAGVVDGVDGVILVVWRC
jgi:hypothetical protein